jgi:hypothetical protein
MLTHQDAEEVAFTCARDARLASTKTVASIFWQIALEYQAEAARLNNGKKPHLGDMPLWLKE